MEEDENPPLPLFWSQILYPGKPIEVDGIESGFLVLSNLSIPKYSADDIGQPNRIYAISETHTKSEPSLKDVGVIVGILVPGSIEFKQIRFKIPPNSKITLKTSGNCAVHIIGHYEYENEQSEYDENDEEELPQLDFPVTLKSTESKDQPPK